MQSYLYSAADLAATGRLARALARQLADGMAIGLIGPLGAGKTTLVRGIAEACGIDPRQVVSPTFVLQQDYLGRRTLHHFDAYRLAGAVEFADLGVEETFASGGVSFIEWADRVADCLPDDRLTITIETTGEASRRFTLTGSGVESRAIVAAVASELAAETT